MPAEPKGACNRRRSTMPAWANPNAEPDGAMQVKAVDGVPLVKKEKSWLDGIERSASGSWIVGETAQLESKSASGLEDNVAHLRTVLNDLPSESAPHLLQAAFLERCLRSKKLSRVKAEAVVRRYAKFRLLPGWETVNAAGVLREALTGFNTLLPCTDVGGRVVLTQRMARLDLRLSDGETGAPGSQPPLTSCRSILYNTAMLEKRRLHRVRG